MIIYIIGAIISCPLIARMFFLHTQGSFPNIAEELKRDDIGWGIVLGLLYSMIWPIGIIMCFLMTGFGKHGIISKKNKKIPFITKVGMLRMWLNEDRITDPKKMITNQDIIDWLK